MIEVIAGLMLLGLLALACVMARLNQGDDPCADCKGFNGDKVLCREHCQAYLEWIGLL